jgi:hypothetical protein
MLIIFGSTQLKMRPINILWGPIDLEERKKSSCLNVRDKLNGQNQACLSFAIASEYLT